jgi:hypothetical protein
MWRAICHKVLTELFCFIMLKSTALTRICLVDINEMMGEAYHVTKPGKKEKERKQDCLKLYTQNTVTGQENEGMCQSTSQEQKGNSRLRKC